MPEAISIYTPSSSDVAVPTFHPGHAIRTDEVAIAACHGLTWPALMWAFPVETALGDTPDSMTPVPANMSPSIDDVAPSTLSSTSAIGTVAPLAGVSLMATLSARLLTKPARRTGAITGDLIILDRT